jgi:hypothetical protein
MTIFYMGEAIIVCDRVENYVRFRSRYDGGPDPYESELCIGLETETKIALAACRRFIADVRDVQAKAASACSDNLPDLFRLIVTAC